MTTRGHFKDQILDRLAETANVAQFVSFNTDLEVRFSRVRGFQANERFRDPETAIEALLRASAESSVNVRSFDPLDPKSREFVYGIKSVDSALEIVTRLAGSGLHTIVNETVNVEDGGVSGVVLGDLIEFAPGQTPRAVEKGDCAALQRKIGIELLGIVYGFRPALDFAASLRVEFSIHPLRRGIRNEHTIIWETEEVGPGAPPPLPHWPNAFSRFIGDKVFGLLIAHLYGLPVPRTRVINRNIAPFEFGQPTGTGETWIRTCPSVQLPGQFTTTRGWQDPFKLIQDEDRDATIIPSILAQDGIEALYSGALVVAENNGQEVVTIEGTYGFGDEFMVGKKAAQALPESVRHSVQELYSRISKQLGPVRMEWVADRENTWVVQFHRGATQSAGRVIYPGTPVAYTQFDVGLGLDSLRKLIDEVCGKNIGIVLKGNVGVTSHLGDVLRKAKIPSYIEPA